jgi:hypothetical protein
MRSVRCAIPRFSCDPQAWMACSRVRSRTGRPRITSTRKLYRARNYEGHSKDYAQDHSGACHGERGTAAGLSGRRDRWRALLGRRPCVQHASAVGDREQPTPPGYARISGRSLELARCASAQHGGGRHPPQGDPVFEPHPRQQWPVQERASGPARPCCPAAQASCRLRGER